MRYLFLTLLLVLALPACAQDSGFMLTSPELTPNQIAPDWMIYNGNDCAGKNQSPELTWTDPPRGTQSFALTAFDPDAKPGGWMHWIVMNLRPDVTRLPHDAGRGDGGLLPIGANSIPNGFGKTGFSGPCPPLGSGTHRYIFTLYALPQADVEYPLNAIGQSTVNWLEERALGTTSFMVTYDR